MSSKSIACSRLSGALSRGSGAECHILSVFFGIGSYRLVSSAGTEKSYAFPVLTTGERKFDSTFRLKNSTEFDEHRDAPRVAGRARGSFY
jgi:hypothetical protein